MTIRVVLVDDHDLVRKGIAAVLSDEPDIEVVAQCASGEEALECAERLRPDVVLVDLRMPGMSGIETTAQLRERVPEAGVLVLTVSEYPRDLREALRAGARGYLLKGVTPSELAQAVRQVAGGWMVVSPSMAMKMVGDTPSGTAAPEGRGGEQVPPGEVLSAREREVLLLLSDGMSNREIAARLELSENTVKTHMRSILTKLHLRNRAQAAAYARRFESVSGR